MPSDFVDDLSDSAWAGHIHEAEDLLTERPDIDGIALPGMPSGSLGMPGDKCAPFEVLVIDDGTTAVFGEY